MTGQVKLLLMRDSNAPVGIVAPISWMTVFPANYLLVFKCGGVYQVAGVAVSCESPPQCQGIQVWLLVVLACQSPLKPDSTQGTGGMTGHIKDCPMDQSHPSSVSVCLHPLGVRPMPEHRQMPKRSLVQI